jgi:hypothetical protein
MDSGGVSFFFFQNSLGTRLMQRSGIRGGTRPTFSSSSLAPVWAKVPHSCTVCGSGESVCGCRVRWEKSPRAVQAERIGRGREGGEAPTAGKTQNCSSRGRFGIQLKLSFHSHAQLVDQGSARPRYQHVAPAFPTTPQSFARVPIDDCENRIIHDGRSPVRTVAREIIAKVWIHRKQENKIGVIAISC